jgi:hypothetical protein
MPNGIQREILPIPDRRQIGLTTYDPRGRAPVLGRWLPRLSGTVSMIAGARWGRLTRAG